MFSLNTMSHLVPCLSNLVPFSYQAPGLNTKNNNNIYKKNVESPRAVYPSSSQKFSFDFKPCDWSKMLPTCPDSFTDPFICDCKDGFAMAGFRTQRLSTVVCSRHQIALGKRLHRLTSFHPRRWLLLAAVSSSSSFSSFVFA